MKDGVTSRTRWEVPAKVYFICVIVIVLAVCAQTWWSISQDRNLTISTAQESSLLAVRVLEEHASRIMQDTASVISATAAEVRNHDVATSNDEQALRQILTIQRQDSQYLQTLGIINTSGILWATSFQYPSLRPDLSDRGYVKYLLQHPEEKNTIVGAANKLKAAHLWLLPVAKNLYDVHGHRTGIIQAEISLGYFGGFYDRVAKDGGAVVSMRDQNGDIVIRAPFDERYLNVDLSRAEIAKRIRSASLEGVLIAPSLLEKGVTYLAAYRKLPNFPITLVYSKNLDTILRPWEIRLFQRIVFAGLILLFIFGLVAVLWRNIRSLEKSKLSLGASENRYRLLYQGAQDAILLINSDYEYVDCNPAALELFGIQSMDDIIGKRVGEYSVPIQSVRQMSEQDRYALVKKLVDSTFAGNKPRFEWATLRKGELLYSEITLSRVEMEQDVLVFCVMRNINARKYAERLLEGQNRLLQLIGGNDDLPAILESVCNFVENLNTQWCCSIQLLSEDQQHFHLVSGNKVSEKFKTDICASPVAEGNDIWSEAVQSACPIWRQHIPHADMLNYWETDAERNQYRSFGAWPIMGKNGQLLGAMTLFFPSHEKLSDENQSLIAITTDIASIAIEDRRAEERILKLAHYDELTGLPNRFLYGQHLAKSLAFAERNHTQLAVLFLDLDRFKNINDTFGHGEGDAVLRSVAKRFKHCLRESDTIARVGGDEFILLIEHFHDSKHLVDISKKLLAAACQPFEIHGQECQLSASIGIATYPDDGRDDQTLLKNADIAMYRAKHKGKDTYQFYASEMNIHTVERLAFEARLRKALERREFVVHYQPKVEINTGRIVGAEALVRWNHPERGILPPGEFITLAEEAGLISKLGMLVLDIACRDVLVFRKVDPDFGRVAINLSGAQFNEINLLKDVQSVVDFWRVSPGNVEFEITESMVMHNREQAIVLMDGFKAAGFTLSIDDFGTGYSSLAYLKRFPVNSVKIDRSFIKDIPDDPNDTAIVRAIVAMAHTLGMKVIAEGVETQSQLDTLQASACDEYQGYFFSKPVTEIEFSRLLRKNLNLADFA